MEDSMSLSCNMKSLAILNNCDKTVFQSLSCSNSATTPLRAVVKELFKQHDTTWLKIMS